MNGWLVVNNFINDRKFNELYSWFLDASKENNIELSLKRTGDLISVLGEKPYNDTPDFVLFWDKDIYLAQRLELMGMKVFNSAHAIEVCDNKALTAIQLSNNSIRIPKTIIAPKTFEGIGYNSTEFIEYAGENLKYPFIIKEVYGSFGQQVYLAETQQQAEIIIKKLDYKDFIMQELIKSSWGKDIRINIVENRAVASMYRYSTVGDFRSNITLGGQMETYQPNKEQIEIAIQACSAVGVDFGGVDILFGKNDTPIVCEVNSNPHFKTTYECTKINIAKVIIEYIKRKCI